MTTRKKTDKTADDGVPPTGKLKTGKLSEYVPPADGEPLDAVQETLLRALVPMLVEEIREELAAERAARVIDAQKGDVE